jgi:predicted MPP superfamily phosphohydrolase
MKSLVRLESIPVVRGAGRARVLYASDLHLGRPWTKRAATDLLVAARAHRPDVVLLGGDLIDHARGLDPLHRCLSELTSLAPVGAIPGNHDGAIGVERVRACVKSAGAAWLPDGSLKFQNPDGLTIQCDGRLQGRASDADLRVACLHDPKDAPSAAALGYDLALAGHLHGGQCVLFESAGRLYPGAWINRWTGLRFTVGTMPLLVSRGLADTLPLRWNCPREVIVCDFMGDFRGREAPIPRLAADPPKTRPACGP